MDKILNIKILFKYNIFLLIVYAFPLLFPISATAQEANLMVDKKSFFIILMFDKSQSLNIERGNTKYALPAAKYLVELIDVYRQKKDIDIRLDFIPFGESFENISSVSKENILKDIKIGEEKNTDFIPPFRRAMHLVSSSMKSKCLIFLFTDGVPDRQRELTELYSSESDVLDYFNISGIKEDIRILTDIMNVDIEIIGVNDRKYGLEKTRDGNPYFIKNIWNSLLEGDSGSFYSIGNEMLDPMKVVQEVLEKFIYGQSIDWTELKKEEFGIDLEPFLEWAVLSIIKEGVNDTVAIKNSKNKNLIPDVEGNDGHYLIYYLSPPFDEKLIIKSIGDENVWYKINKRYPEVRFELEKKTSKRYEGLPLFNNKGKLELSCSIFRGNSVIKNKDINLKFDGNDMEYDGNGIYTQKISLNSSIEVKIINLEAEAFWKNKKISLNGLDNVKFAVDKISLPEKDVDEKTPFNPYFWIPVLVFLLGFIYFVNKYISPKYRKGKLPFFKRDLNKDINEIKKLFSEKTNIIIKKLNEKSIKEAIDIFKESWVLFYDIQTALADKFDAIPAIYKKLIEAMKGEKYDDKKIFENIIRATTDAPIIFIDGFSKYLNDIRWKDSSFGDKIKDIYLLVERPTPPRRILNSLIIRLEDKDIKEILNLMKDSYDLSINHSEQTLCEILKNFVVIYSRFREKDDIGRIGYELFYSLEKLYEMIGRSPYHKMIEIPEISEGVIRSWLMTSELCQLNVLDVDTEVVFKELKNRMKKCLNILGPERQIVDTLLNKWIVELKNVPSQLVELTFEFLPEISIDKNRLENDWSFFSIKIYCSGGNAYNFNIKLEGEEDDLIDSYTIGKIFKGESAITKLFKVYEPIDNISITYKFDGQYDYESGGHKISYGTIPIKIEEDAKKYNLENRQFIYNTPYIDNNCIFVNRSKELEKLKESILYNERSDIFNIFGIRGIGKTSLIKRFRESYSQNKNIKDTLINNTIFSDENIQTVENFLGHLARNIMFEYEKTPSFEYEELSASEVNLWKIDKFKEFIVDLMAMQSSNHKHIIFLDDADIFEEVNYAGEYRHLDLFKLLKFLHELIIGLDISKGKMYIVFSGHKDALGDKWSKAGFWPSEKNINLKLLEKDEILEIASEGGLLLNELSLRYMMNLTGGHPELVHLMCSKIKKSKTNVSELSKSISMKVISNAVFDISYDPLLKGGFQYIIGYSLPRNLHHDLLKAVRDMDKETLVFKKELLASNNFTKLIENGFIEFKDSKSAHVRIGILKFLPEDYIIVTDDWYESHA